MRHDLGYVQVPFKVPGDPFAIMEQARDEAIEVTGDESWFCHTVGHPMQNVFLQTVFTRIARIESTVAPDYRFALVEVEGKWVDAEGDVHWFHSPSQNAHQWSGGAHGPDYDWEFCACGWQIDVHDIEHEPDTMKRYEVSRQRREFHRWQAIREATTYSTEVAGEGL